MLLFQKILVVMAMVWFASNSHADWIKECMQGERWKAKGFDSLTACQDAQQSTAPEIDTGQAVSSLRVLDKQCGSGSKKACKKLALSLKHYGYEDRALRVAQDFCENGDADFCRLGAELSTDTGRKGVFLTAGCDLGDKTSCAKSRFHSDAVAKQEAREANMEELRRRQDEMRIQRQQADAELNARLFQAGQQIGRAISGVKTTEQLQQENIEMNNQLLKKRMQSGNSGKCTSRRTFLGDIETTCQD